MFLSAYLTDGPLDINEPLYVQGNDFTPAHYQAATVLPITTLTQEGIIYIRTAAIMNACAMHNSCMPMFMKTHSANVKILEVPLIPHLLTHSAVYLIRDPRDVAVSWSEHLQQPLDATIEKMGQSNLAIKRTEDDKIVQNLCSWSMHVESWMSSKGIKVIVCKYEDMLRNPEDMFTQILNHIEIPFSQECMDHALHETQLSNLQKQEKDRGFRESQPNQTFFAHGRSGVYKDKLTPEQIKKIETDHGPMMKKLGYL
jgi:aryl sulfotransferase